MRHPLTRFITMRVFLFAVAAVLIPATALAGLLEDGRAAVRGGNFDAAVKWFSAAAEAGSAVAETELGALFERGVNGPPDYAEARMWYHRAAENGEVAG